MNLYPALSDNWQDWYRVQMVQTVSIKAYTYMYVWYSPKVEGKGNALFNKDTDISP